MRYDATSIFHVPHRLVFDAARSPTLRMADLAGRDCHWSISGHYLGHGKVAACPSSPGKPLWWHDSETNRGPPIFDLLELSGGGRCLHKRLKFNINVTLRSGLNKSHRHCTAVSWSTCSFVISFAAVHSTFRRRGPPIAPNHLQSIKDICIGPMKWIIRTTPSANILLDSRNTMI